MNWVKVGDQFINLDRVDTALFHRDRKVVVLSLAQGLIHVGDPDSRPLLRVLEELVEASAAPVELARALRATEQPDDAGLFSALEMIRELAHQLRSEAPHGSFSRNVADRILGEVSQVLRPKGGDNG